jgi:aminoglycoside phosphotransferase (APT) family kinase protein
MSDLDLARVREITGRSFAERDMITLRRDDFTVVVLADDLMVYVPTKTTQRRILARIAPRLSFAVPRPVGPIDLDIDLRVPAPGSTGSTHHERLMREPELLARTAEWMGRALAELHGSLAKIELDSLGVPRAPWPYLAEALERGVDAHLEGDARARAHEAIGRWRARDAEPDVLVHGDFASHNFAFDAKSGMPCGVFDFHGGGRGPRVIDFAYLPSYGADATRSALAAYGSNAPSLADVRLAHAVVALSFLGWRAIDADAHDRTSGRDRAAAVSWAHAALEAAILDPCPSSR